MTTTWNWEGRIEEGETSWLSNIGYMSPTVSLDSQGLISGDGLELYWHSLNDSYAELDAYAQQFDSTSITFAQAYIYCEDCSADGSYWVMYNTLGFRETDDVNRPYYDSPGPTTDVDVYWSGDITGYSTNEKTGFKEKYNPHGITDIDEFKTIYDEKILEMVEELENQIIERANTLNFKKSLAPVIDLENITAFSAEEVSQESLTVSSKITTDSSLGAPTAPSDGY